MVEQRLNVAIDPARLTAVHEETPYFGWQMVVRSAGDIVAYFPVSTSAEVAIQDVQRRLPDDVRYTLALEHEVLRLREKLDVLGIVSEREG